MINKSYLTDKRNSIANYGTSLRDSKENINDPKENKNETLSILLNKSKKGYKQGHHLDNTRISQINERHSTKIQDDEETKNNKMLDKLFAATGTDLKKLRKYGRNVYLENEKNELNISRKMDHYIKNVLNENFASRENNSNDYELVEKTVLDKLKNENNGLLMNIKELEDKIGDIKKFNFKTVSEENFLKHAVSLNEKNKNNILPKSTNVLEEIKKAKNLNKNLKGILSSEKIQNDNMNQAIKTIFAEIDVELLNEYEELVKKYDNFNFIEKKKYFETHKTIEEMLGKIDQLEKQKFSKEVELKNLKKNKAEKLWQNKK